MDSPAAVHKSYQRFFVWTFVLSALLAGVLIWIELAFPEKPWIYPAPPSPSGPPTAGFDLHDLQLLVIVAALIAAVAALIGLVVTTPLAWLDARKARAHAALELALKRQDHINWLAAERAGRWPSGVTSMPRLKHRVRGRLARRIHGGVHSG